MSVISTFAMLYYNDVQTFEITKNLSIVSFDVLF